MEIAPIGLAHWTASLLIIATPPITRLIERVPFTPNMEPPTLRLDGRSLLVKSERPEKPGGISGSSVWSNMVSPRCVPNWCQARVMEREDFKEAFPIRREASRQMVGALRGNSQFLPVEGHTRSGRRILHPRHRGCA